MSSSSCRSSIPSIAYWIILVGLLYAFHIELFVTGLRLYASVVNSPRSERLLAEYYRNSAHLSSDLSHDFYVNALQKYQANLPSANAIEQANIKFQIGRLYLCGKGVLANQNDAKRWFGEAEQAAEMAVKNGEKNHEQLIQDIKQAVSSPTTTYATSACQLQMEAEFLKNVLNALKW